ncbi:lysophospholipid acyltransferase family protein [Thiorhodovibrio frisius]|uniref:Lauroyl/myristoyl acyltransferase n=1 Tax=Thiorhodovibrio frisius TaxID=631362 RepID=H8Z1K7_9GAMM|nr:Lauroyl/myristoyl acyltransferase [Thiorhodovibrio frisius]WPL24038.1 Lipid A biosynthesis lauroyl acyltransferase [Thiorhodovibrio frisius]
MAAPSTERPPLIDKTILLERTTRALMRLLARLPLPLVHRLGSAIGTLVALFPNRQRRNTLINIGLCLPELGQDNATVLRNRCLREFGKTYAEIAHLWLRPSEDVLSLVRETSGTELLERQPGSGLIVLSPHLGAWELAGLYLAAQGPTAIFYKPQKYLDDLILAARKRSGATLAPITARGIRVLVQALERGEYVGILPDQAPRADKGAVFAPFFGIPAYTMLLVNRLSRKTGAPVVFLFAERLGPGLGYRIHCRKAPEAVASDRDEFAAAALNQGIAECVRTCPEQYLWPYRRFRERLEGMPKFYDGKLSDNAVWEQVTHLKAQLAACGKFESAS